MRRKIKIVDLFAGPGGLSEGFASATDKLGNPLFDVSLSIEKDPIAHKTLALRALFRKFPPGKAPESYYDYIRGNITNTEFYGDRRIAEEMRHAQDEARCATLGETSSVTIDKWIRESIGADDLWVLIGGPPCQAYSLAGRSRMRSTDPRAFEEDSRHFLYKEYLRIIRKFQPAVFVMENVKGILSSTHGGSPIFQRILDDLSQPSTGLRYQIRSFTVDGTSQGHDAGNFIIRAEQFGVPQKRHRVILLGVRSDYEHLSHARLRAHVGLISVHEALAGMPIIRSRLTKENDGLQHWIDALRETPRFLNGWRSEVRSEIEDLMKHCIRKSANIDSVGDRFLADKTHVWNAKPEIFHSWIADKRIGGVCQHQSRGHMRSDLQRYLFSACYANVVRQSPKLGQFPKKLLPAHKNAKSDNAPFEDRFRVQLQFLPSTTVVSHIAKDGHYYIHYDPSQCRSLTVREAARLQTFPDNYFFEGNKTQQYHQVGNAVPPYLARQMANVVFNFLASVSTAQKIIMKRSAAK